MFRTLSSTPLGGEEVTSARTLDDTSCSAARLTCRSAARSLPCPDHYKLFYSARAGIIRSEARRSGRRHRWPSQPLAVSQPGRPKLIGDHDDAIVTHGSVCFRNIRSRGRVLSFLKGRVLDAKVALDLGLWGVLRRFACRRAAHAASCASPGDPVARIGSVRKHLAGRRG